MSEVSIPKELRKDRDRLNALDEYAESNRCGWMVTDRFGIFLKKGAEFDNIRDAIDALVVRRANEAKWSDCMKLSLRKEDI